MQDIRAITLDLDDTLWDIWPVIMRAEEAVNSWFAEHYPRIPEQWPRERVVELREEIVARNDDRAHDLTFLRKELIGEMAVAVGYSRDIREDAFAVFDDHRNRVELYPDVLPALEKLRVSFRLVAVTNGNARLERIGIEHLFDDFVSARTAGAAKPHPRIFAAAIEAGGAAADHTLHVGDSPTHDVDGARRAGMRTAWVNRKVESWPDDYAAADLEVTDLGVLADFLAGDGA